MLKKYWALLFLLIVPEMALGVLPMPRPFQGLSCDDSSAATTSAGVQTFLDGITSGGASQEDPRVVCLTASTITITSQISWSVPDNIVLLGNGDLTMQGGGSGWTVLQDDFNSASNTFVFNDIDAYFRMAGFKYIGPSTGGVKNGAVMSFSGDTTLFRFDHITWDSTSASDQVHWMNFSGCLYGLLDHVVWNLPNDLAWLHITNGSCDDFMGNGRWVLPTGFGGPNFLYVEDSEWLADGDPSVSDTTVTDCHTSGKYVIRFNTVTAATIGQTHPTIHGADDRGCRAHEIYGNTQRLATAGDDPAFALSASNSGPSMVWGNDIGTGNVERMLQRYNCRVANCGYAHTATPDNWGPCDGTSDWDGNMSSGWPCIDQPGQGITEDSISGVFPDKINDRTSGIDWPIQTTEGDYEWLNTGTPTQTYFVNLDSSSVLQEDRDYFLYTGSFDGTSGVGSGTLASRPSTCTTGVAYWATDQGSWNSSTSNPEGVDVSGADGVLYKCTATNTWTLYYTPYDYPHPLQGAGGGGGGGGTTSSGHFRIR